MTADRPEEAAVLALDEELLRECQRMARQAADDCGCGECGWCEAADEWDEIAARAIRASVGRAGRESHQRGSRGVSSWRADVRARSEAVDAWWEFRRRLPPPKDGNWQKGMARWIDRYLREQAVV